MMKKSIWITSLAHDEAGVQRLMATLKTYVLESRGHFWVDDLKKMAWLGPREEILRPETALWIILAKELTSPSVRLGLSLLALSVQAQRGHGFPILLIHQDGPPDPLTLPTPLQGVELLAASNHSLGVKIVTLANRPVRKVEPEYRINIHAMPQLGLWFEVGPAKAAWRGAMFGVSGGEIDVHGVGPKGTIPQKAVLEYPMEGLKLTLGEREFTAWAVQNALDQGLSYYLRVQGDPSSILLGPLAEGDEAEAFVLNLC